MIKLIEEDADSFARRAEMYYKKRPELMKLVEEFYRAYRALSERYDHATGALRQAQRTMAEAFPNQAPFILGDDSPAGSATDCDPHSVPGRKGLKQFNDLFGLGDGVDHAKFAEGRVRKGLNFNDPEEKERGVQNNGSHDLKARVPSESEQKSPVQRRIPEGLNERASKAEAEVQTLKEALAQLEAEKESSFLQYQGFLEKISNLENNLSLVQKDAGELNERASKAETEAQSLKQDLSRLEAEKIEAQVQYSQCLEKISDLEDKLQNAQEDARRFSERADDAEREIETLKHALTKLTEEKEAAVTLYQQCLATIVSLEHKIACYEEEARRLNSVIDHGTVKLEGSEERCLLLEKSNQTIHSELESSMQKVAAQSDELTEKQKELGKLWTCVQEERLRFMEAETAFQTLQHLHSQSQEELRSMAAQLQNRAQILEDLEARNHGLKDDVEHVKLENKSLSEVNLSSALTIQNLQDDISSLRETIKKLEEEVELRVDQRNALQQEIYCLKEELNELNRKHLAIMRQVDSVGFNPESFGSSVKDLKDVNIKLKELENMEKLIEKNALLENSLSDLNVELEGVGEKLKALEESCQSLLEEKSILVSEKDLMASVLQFSTDNLEKLTEKNHILESFLLDANSELEGLREKSKSLEDLCLMLVNEKSELASIKGSLSSQLDISEKSLQDLEKNYTELEEKYSLLEKERQSTLHEVQELQICLLQEESQCRNKEYEKELDKAVNAEIEIFILQKCAQDLEEKNCSLLLDHQKLVEASKLSEKLISDIRHENHEQREEVVCLSDQIKTLRMGLYQVLMALELDANQCENKSKQDQRLLNRVLNRLQESQEFLFKMQDENQRLFTENSVLVTLLGQLQLENERQELSGINEEMKLKLIEGDCKGEALKVELNNLRVQLSDLKGAQQNLQEENCKVLDDQRSLMKSFSDLQTEKCELEEENFCILVETVSQSTLSLIFRDIICEKSVEIKSLGEHLDKLCHDNNGLNEKVKTLEKELDKFSALVDEKTELHKMVENLKCKYDEVEVIRSDQEMQISKLSGDYDQKNKEAENIHEVNQKLESEIRKLHEEFEEVKDRKENLSHELVKERNEAELQESQAVALFGELQVSAVREALFEGKLHELLKICESLEDGNCSKDMEIDQLKERFSTLEGANAELKALVAAYLPAFMSLRDCVTSLEEHTLPDATLHEGDSKESKDAAVVMHAKGFHQMSEGQSDMVPGGTLDLQDLQIRIKAVEEEIIEKERLAMLENLSYHSKLDAAMRQIEELKYGSSARQKGVETRRYVKPKPEDGELGAAPSDDLRQQKRTHEISEDGNEVMTKDIILDQMSECSSYGISRRETMQADEQMLEIWEAAARDGSIDLTVGKTQKVTASQKKKKHIRQHPSAESMVEKEVGVDKLEISKRLSGSRQEGNGRRILERLDSDAQKLTNLQITVQDLMSKVEITEKSKKGKGIEYDNVKEQLEESEEAILKLFEVNRKLMKTVEDEPLYFNEKSEAAPDESGSVRRRKTSEQARRVSEKIGRLQLEVQKLQFVLLKLDDENRSRGKTKITERKTKVLLQDYLYGGGTRTRQMRKKGNFCSCVQPPTKGD
ncbi:hypothetical protein OIU76_006852 [Salix suchowensis]|nr:hypothetical protein OIU76_006852 [Salix suchowensis]